MALEAGIQSDVTYEARQGKLEPCMRWQLVSKALIYSVDQKGETRSGNRSVRAWPQSVPYGEIATIRLSYNPTRFDSNRYRCDLQGPGGARISIISTSYVGLASFEDRGTQFAVFVRELVRRVQRVRPSAKIFSGLSWPAYCVQHGLVLFALITLVSLLGIAGLPAFGSVYVKLAITALYCAVLWRYTRLNRPRDLTLPPSA